MEKVIITIGICLMVFGMVMGITNSKTQDNIIVYNNTIVYNITPECPEQKCPVIPEIIYPEQKCPVMPEFVPNPVPSAPKTERPQLFFNEHDFIDMAARLFANNHVYVKNGYDCDIANMEFKNTMMKFGVMLDTKVFRMDNGEFHMVTTKTYEYDATPVLNESPKTQIVCSEQFI